MIEIKELTVKYRGTSEDISALNGLNLDVKNGDICTIIGPSGCGKSTLLHVLSGIHKDYSGNVLIDGSEINPKLHKIGLVLQNYGLLPWKNIEENALLGLRLKGEKSDEYKDHILKELGLLPMLKRFPKELSGGQKQRVAIARAFILRPNLLLMDEPFSALDAITREEMQQLFLEIWKKNRVTTIFITHSIDEAICLGKKIVILSPSPGKVLHVVDNKAFGLGNLRLRDEYYALSKDIRKIIEMSWSKC